MNKSLANDILDRIKSGENLPISLTIEALQTLGDISRLSIDETTPSGALRIDGNEQRVDRSCTIYGEATIEIVGWSKYLDSKTH